MSKVGYFQLSFCCKFHKGCFLESIVSFLFLVFGSMNLFVRLPANWFNLVPTAGIAAYFDNIILVLQLEVNLLDYISVFASYFSCFFSNSYLFLIHIWVCSISVHTFSLFLKCGIVKIGVVILITLN